MIDKKVLPSAGFCFTLAKADCGFVGRQETVSLTSYCSSNE